MKRNRQARLRRLRRICDALEVDALVGELILAMVERLDEAQKELNRLREAYSLREFRTEKEEEP